MFEPMQTSFADAILDADRRVPDGVIAHNALTPARRFAVYRNNVVVSLGRALASRFPVVQRIVGDEFFAATARVFVTTHPPRSPLPMIYGDGFPEFIGSFEPAAELPYLADVARLEAARTRAYHAADARPLGPAHFADIPPDAMATLRLRLHPSCEIVRSNHPIVTIWAMNSGEAALRPIEHWRSEDALIVRPHLQVEVRALPRGAAAFLLALSAGRPLAAAAEAAAEDSPEFDLAKNLAGLIGSGLAADILPPNVDRPS